MSVELGLSERAAEMRAAFDRSFAEPLRFDDAPSENFLAIRLGQEPYAVRLGEIVGLFVDKKITPVPSNVSTLLGIAGFRGVVVPVYDLRKLLGYAGGVVPRWLMLAATVAFAFDASDGQTRIPRAMIAPRETSLPSQKYVREVARASDHLRPIVDLAFLIQELANGIR